MRAAGINPVLAGRFDASTPPGAMAHMENIGANMVQGYTSTKNAKSQRMLADKQMKLLDSEIAVNQAQAGNLDSAASLNRIRQELVGYQAEIAERAATFSQMVISLIPEEVRNNPDKTLEYIEGKLRDFREANPDLERIWSKLKGDLLRIISTGIGGLANIMDPGGAPSKVDDRVYPTADEERKRIEKLWQQAQKPLWRGGYSYKGTLREYWRTRHSKSYKRYWRD